MGPNVHLLSSQSACEGADEVPGRCRGTLRVAEVYDAWHGLQTYGVVVHVNRCEGDCVSLLVRRPSGGRLNCIKDL